ncbi:MAG: hypothetical protein QW292_07650 [Candidatus Parvarchaeota archaeon]
MTKPIGSFKLSYWTVMRNRRISRKRALVEYSFEIMKSVFHFSHTLVTLSRRVRVKCSCFPASLMTYFQ